MKISSRTFIVSGGSSGLGLAAVRDLLEANAYVAILDRATPPELDDIAADALSRLMYIEMDITKLAQIENAVERAISWAKNTGAALGGVINTAGIALAASLLNQKGEPHSARVWDHILAVNLTGTFHLTRLATKHLACVPRVGADGERGVVIMISSTVAYEGLYGQTAYAATKGAIRSMTLPMARDLARYGIRVVTIAPGPFKTPMTARFSDKVTEGLEKHAMLFPKRYGAPEEFASTVRWILECAYVNGETVKMTGGARVPALL